MRRLVVLFVVALVGAALFGFSGWSSGVSVDHQSVSASSLNAELSAITTNPTLGCYIEALNPASYGAGAGGDTLKSSATAAWVDLRVEGLAIDHYVVTTWHYHPSAADLASAKTSLVSELAEQATANSETCPGSAASAVAAMPAEMRSAEIVAQASSLYLVKKLNDTIPLTTSAMEAYYHSHQSDYDTLCISVAVVSVNDISAFGQAQAQGASVTALVKKFSLDATSKAKGGAYGCYAPSSEYYAAVRQDASSATLDEFPTKPAETEFDGTEAALYVAVTKRSHTSFANAESAVLTDLKEINAEGANTVKNTVLEQAAVYVDPTFGQWGVSASEGPIVAAPSAPRATGVTGASQLSAGAAKYQ
ncbi:MAG TPA: hypothetical protein VGG21_07520 [Acidimicrobiales bacterium]